MLNRLFGIVDRLRQFRERRTLAPDAALGRRGEDLAHRYLQRQGYLVCARNWRTPSGVELDLVARDGDALVFVEVKTRHSGEHSAPDRAIDAEKQRHVARAAALYARHAKVEWLSVRFDVVSVIVENGSRPVVEHFRDAFRPARNGVR